MRIAAVSTITSRPVRPRTLRALSAARGAGPAPRRGHTGRSLARIGALAGTLAAVAACNPDLMYPTMGNVKELDRVQHERFSLLERSMTDQHEALAPDRSAELKAIEQTTMQALDDLRERVRTMQSALQPVLEQIAAFASQLFGIPGSVSDYVADSVRQVHEAVDADLSAIGQRIDAVRSEQASAVAALRESLKDLALARKLDDQQLLALQQALAAHEQELLSLQNDPERLRSTVLAIVRDAGMGPEVIESLRQAEQGELLKLTLTLLGGGAIGVAGGRIGPSRAQKEIEALKTSVSRPAA